VIEQKRKNIFQNYQTSNNKMQWRY